MTDQPTAATPSPDASVRRARPGDADAMAALTLAAWRSQPPELLPGEALAALDADEIAAEWREAVSSPPSTRHVVLVALDAEDVVGYALAEPSQDPDAAPDGTSAELLDLVVRPDRTRHGHGARLLAAAVDTLRERGVSEILTWVTIGDDARMEFLASAGLESDGASRTLDGGPGTQPLRQVRWSAALG